MIVEVFKKGTDGSERMDSQNHHNTFWNIKRIEQDAGKFILVKDTYPLSSEVLPCDLYMLRVLY